MKEDVKIEGIYEMLYPTQVVLVTSVDKNGKPNVITMSWVMPTSFDPPMVAISIRPERYSYSLIKQSREFVVNIPTAKLVKEVMICGTTSGANTDKFSKTKMTPLPAKKVKPPIIKECIAHLECKIAEEMKTGTHILIVGNVLAAYAEKKAFLEKRYIVESIPLLLALQDYPHLFTTPQKIISLDSAINAGSDINE
jgi:flavin reductase (DIM6/NTAB) family NADH-FMN oxidoreductase RutF